MDFLNTAELANASEFATFGRGTSNQNGAGGPGQFPFTSTYGMNRGPTPFFGEGQTAMGTGQRSEEGMNEDNQLQPLTYSEQIPNLGNSMLFKGVILFRRGAAQTQKESGGVYDTLPLWQLNHSLEVSALSNAHSQLAAGLATRVPTPYPGIEDGAARLSKRDRAQHINALTYQYDAWMSTLPQRDSLYRFEHRKESIFTDNISFAGVFAHGAADPTLRTARANIAQQNYMPLPNLWGQLKIGDKVGFILKWVRGGYYPGFYNRDGDVSDSPSTVPFAQLVPYVCKDGGRVPPARLGVSAEQDVHGSTDSFVPCVRELTYAAYDELGRPTTARRNEKQPVMLQYERLDHGKPFFLGTVATVAKLPSAESRRRALRSPAAYRLLCTAEFGINVLLGCGVG